MNRIVGSSSQRKIAVGGYVFHALTHSMPLGKDVIVW